MRKIHKISSSQLYAPCISEKISWKDSREIPRYPHFVPHKHLLQPRAVQALELALNISVTGYNVFLSGENNLGRSYLLREFLAPKAQKKQTPPDFLYLNNFNEPDHPLLLALPAGKGSIFRDELATVLQKINKNTAAKLEADSYVREKNRILNKFQTARSTVLTQMNAMAATKGFNLDIDEGDSLTLYPLIDGRRLEEDEYKKLDENLRKKIKEKGDCLLRDMTGFVHQLARAEQDLKDDEHTLDTTIIAKVLDVLFVPFQKRTAKLYRNEKLDRHLHALKKEITEHPEAFLPREQNHGDSLRFSPQPAPNMGLTKYYANLFVDNGKTHGAPVIFCDNPTASNLMGCIERESEMGALVTDFSLIKAGDLHRAYGGFLILRVEDIFQHPSVWENLLRSLRSEKAVIEESWDQENSPKTKGIEPEAFPLDLKVILIGNELIYEQLLAQDERFAKLFRIKAHLTDTIERNTQSMRIFMQRLAVIIDELQLPVFSRNALASLIDTASQLVEDQKKLSLKFPLIREIMIEASALAQMRNEKIVTSEILATAESAKIYRSNLVEELFMEEYDRQKIKVRTSGKSIGRVNGLSVSMYGDFEFGLPHQISCTVGVGHEGVIDLEREAELGGPIHTKAMMILKSYLTDQFAKNKPLVLTGSLCFEQSYAGIEGDSASGAELVALLSALAQAPVRLDTAFTGAVSQSGQIMAVGGVTKKIEGFFRVCNRHGLTGEQGVIIPADNIDHLMLSREVRDAVAQEQFHIYAVQHIEDALEILTGLPAGKCLKNGHFTRNSLYDMVDRRLEALGEAAFHAFNTRKKKK